MSGCGYVRAGGLSGREIESKWSGDSWYVKVRGRGGDYI